MSKKIAIRTDTNEVIATGHIMRCLSIAGRINALGAEAVIIAADEMAVSYAERAHVNVHVLGTAWDDPESETDVLIDYLHSESIEVCLVDHYSVTDEYFSRLRSAGIRVMYMDDMARHAFPVDALLNYCPAATSLGYEHMYSEDTKLYLGASYIPVREQFSKDYDSDRNGLLITAGGSDSMHIADCIIDGILSERSFGFTDSAAGRIHLLAGQYYKPTEIVTDAVEAGYVILHQNVDNVAQIMGQCSVAISSAGSTLFELAAMGVITASFVFVDNQMTDAMFFDREGLMPYVGDFRVSANRCMEHIIDFLYEIGGMNDSDRAVRRGKLKVLVDGRGAERTAQALIDMYGS